MKKSGSLKAEVKAKLPIKKEGFLFGEKDEAINTLTLEIKLLTEELEATNKRIRTSEAQAVDLEGRIANLRSLLRDIQKS